MKIDELKQLIEIFNDSSLTSLSIDDENGKISFEKNTSATTAVLTELPAPQVVVQAQTVSVPVAVAEDDGKTVNSPIVGVAYRAANPDSKPFVQVGDKVKKGQTLCVIEAMKMFNDIASTQDGIIKEICFEDGTLVEYDSVLFRISAD